MKKRSIALFLAVMMIAASLTALARASDQLSSYNITVSDVGGGIVRVTASVCGTHSRMTKIGFPTIVLYEKVNGVWSAVKTVNSQYNYDAGSHGYQYDFQGVVGRSYQAYASFAATDSKGGDSRNADSNNVTLQ